MIRLLSKCEKDRRCACSLIESDRRYFEMAAEVQTLSIGELAWMPDLTELAASCVIHRIDFDQVSTVRETWFDEMEQVFKERSVLLARVYLDNCPRYVHAMFLQHGYARRVEIGFLAPVGHPDPPAGVRLCEVLTEDDWRLKHSIHEKAMDGPDGYTNQADLWIDMERQKCATGKMQSFLVRRDDEVVATVGAIVHDGLLRLKNIVVAPEFRRCGLGVATVHLLWQMAEADHGCRFGVFGVEGGKGDRLYTRAGLCKATRQYEWSRLITGQQT